MKHSFKQDKNTRWKFIETLEFTDPYPNPTKIKLKCKWELVGADFVNSTGGVLRRTGESIVEKLRARSFDDAIIRHYEQVYSQENMQALAVMMLMGEIK